MTMNPGQTTRQMVEAPKGAMFVYAGALPYAIALAAHLKRTDLIVTGPGVFDNNGVRLVGRKLPAIVLDHAAWRAMTNRQLDVCRQFQDRIKRGPVEVAP